MMLQKIISEFKKLREAGKQYGIGFEFNEEAVDARLIELEASVDTSSIYIPFSVYASDTNYFLVNNDNILVYIGRIDKEGLQDTLAKDFKKTNAFINVNIAVATDDDEMLKTFFSDMKNLATLLNHMASGINSIVENGHMIDEPVAQPSKHFH